jgi:LysM repeat protein
MRAGTVLASAPLRTLSEPPLVTFERTEDEEYLVEDGQTLSEIAALFGLDYYYLAEVNRLEDPDQVHAGQRIVIPPAPDNLKQTE